MLFHVEQIPIYRAPHAAEHVFWVLLELRELDIGDEAESLAESFGRHFQGVDERLRSSGCASVF